MKKIFLLFGVAAFSSATAQQNDLFDIQKHIQKKQAEGKKAAEKKLLLTTIKSFQNYNTYSNNIANRSFLLPNGDKVVSLGQDNMPCVVPDMKQFQNMPNLANKEQFNFNYSPQKVLPFQIPNGSIPFRMIASK